MRFHGRHFAALSIAFLLALLALAAPSRAWSYKEHILFTRIAVTRLLDDPTTPPAMNAWLRDATSNVRLDMPGHQEFFLHQKIGLKPEGMTGLSYWAYEPDVHALYDRGDTKIAPFNVHERLLHFIDLELFVAGDRKRGYQHDLSGKPKLADIPHDMTDARYIQAGMLPFRIEYCYGELVKSLREKRLSAPTTQEAQGKTADYWAGYLAHYLADNTQPQHATLDFKSQSYFADKRSGKAPNVHAEVEYRMCDDEANDFMDLRNEYWPLFVKALAEFKDPVETNDPWQSSVQTSLISYDALPMIGIAAMAAAKQGGTPGHPEGPSLAVCDTTVFFHVKGQYMGREMTVMEMKAIQTAWAVKRIEKFYRIAWAEATK